MLLLKFESGKRKGADSLFALVAWELWKERNGKGAFAKPRPRLCRSSRTSALGRPVDRRRGVVSWASNHLVLSPLGGDKIFVNSSAPLVARCCNQTISRS